MRILLLQVAHQLPMAIELCIRILLVKFRQQIFQGLLLLGRSRILGSLAILGTASDIDNTDAVSVVSILIAMGALLINGPAIVD